MRLCPSDFIKVHAALVHLTTRQDLRLDGLSCCSVARRREVLCKSAHSSNKVNANSYFTVAARTNGMTDQMRLGYAMQEEDEEESELSKWQCSAVCCHNTWIEKQIQPGLPCSVQCNVQAWRQFAILINCGCLKPPNSRGSPNRPFMR